MERVMRSSGPTTSQILGLHVTGFAAQAFLFQNLAATHGTKNSITLITFIHIHCYVSDVIFGTQQIMYGEAYFEPQKLS